MPARRTATETTPTPPDTTDVDDRQVRHIGFGKAVWARAQERAKRDGRGIPEVLRQLLAEYADGDSA